MKEPITYQRKLIGVEIKLGFLYVPAQARKNLPNENAEIQVRLPNTKKSNTQSYNSDHNRIFGFTEFYRKHKLEADSLISVEVGFNEIKISIPQKEKIEDSTITEDENFIDFSGLSAQSKGNIGEDRVKEIILIYSQGLLNVYKPVIDDRGIDLIVLKEKLYNPIYLQIKSRFNVHKRNRLILTINGNTFKPHHSYFIVGLNFNQEKMEMDDMILFIPSEEVEKLGTKLSDGNYRLTVSMAGGKTTGRFKKYFITKEELVNNLMEHIDTASTYVR